MPRKKKEEAPEVVMVKMTRDGQTVEVEKKYQSNMEANGWVKSNDDNS